MAVVGVRAEMRETRRDRYVTRRPLPPLPTALGDHHRSPRDGGCGAVAVAWSRMDTFTVCLLSTMALCVAMQFAAIGVAVAMSMALSSWVPTAEDKVGSRGRHTTHPQSLRVRIFVHVTFTSPQRATSRSVFIFGTASCP